MFYVSVPSTSKFSQLSYEHYQCNFIYTHDLSLVNVSLYSLCSRVSTSPQSEIEQLQVQLVTEQKQVSELNYEIASSENRLTNSEREEMYFNVSWTG